MALHQTLRDTEFLRTYSWGKILTLLKKQFEQWAIDRLQSRGYKDFKMAYFPVIMNIDVEGTNNNDLARRARVTKQAMSKVVKELKRMGYVTTKTDPRDKRSAIFTLTEKGKKFVASTRVCVKELMDEYRGMMKKGEFDDLLEKLLVIIDYNDQHFMNER